MADIAGGIRFQDSNITEFLRYKEFYQTIRYDIGIGLAPKVLVFGCSMGAEVQTIYHFWPAAEVYACDIQQDMLEETGKLFPQAHVFPSTPSEIAKHGPFDFICANSVFCRNPLPAGPMSKILPFGLFDEYLSLLTDRLTGDGILMIYNSNYFVQDTSCNKHLVGINISRSWTAAFIPRLTSIGSVCAAPVMVDGVISSYVIDPALAAPDVARLSCALFRKSIFGSTITLNVNSGPLLIAYRPIVSAPLGFPDVPDFRNVYMPYFHTTVCSVGKMRHSVVETYVTDFLAGGWRLHGLTHEVVGEPAS
jgi:hypothetical protein